MQAACGSQSLKILVATNDRAQVRRLSQFLDMMRFDVLQAADAPSALVAIEAEQPALLLLGEDIAAARDWQFCRDLAEHPLGAGAFKFLIVNDPEASSLNEALEAGIDDFLVEPVGFGELLTRLRAAARVLEHDRRKVQQRRVDLETGLLNRPALIVGLDNWLANTANAGEPVACAVLEIDYVDRIHAAQGAAALATVAGTLARQLRALGGENELLARFGPGTFAVVLPRSDAQSAARWAEGVRESLAALDVEAGGNAWRLTASIGVADNHSAKSAAQIVNLATQAVNVAKASGRNCVVRHGEFAADHDELTNPRKLFERTVARDVMTPCTVFLRPEEAAGHAVDLAHQTRLETLIVVGSEGELIGQCPQESLALLAESDYSTRTVREVMTTELRRVDESEPFAALMEAFTHDPTSPLIVVHESRPIGIVTCNSLLVLPQPLTTESLAAEANYQDSSDYLLVADLRPAAEAVTA